jgi:hypothetical protein
MAQPIAVADGIAFAFPDVCLTPVPNSSPVPIPYPNIAQLADAEGTSTSGGDPVTAGGTAILLDESHVASSSGNEAGSNGGVTSGVTGGACTFSSASTSVFIHGKGVVRFGDGTEQNKASPEAQPGNAVGVVLSAFPTVLVGG